MAAPASAAAAGRGAMSTDNAKGLVLAVSSSAFIGASFIIKKMGLRRAADSGVRAAEDGGRGERRRRWGRWRVGRKLAGGGGCSRQPQGPRGSPGARDVSFPLRPRVPRARAQVAQRIAALRPPGTGKTSLVQAMVRECNAHLTMINTYSVHKAHAGEGEKFLREAFSEAYSQASQGRPAVIFIDELDAICPRRDSRREQESRIVAQLLTLMDGNKKSSKTLPHIVVVASTNRVDAIDPALRRPGRFDSEIEVTVPTVEERLQILKLYAKNLHVDESVNLQIIAASCNGYVGADLEALCREAARLAYRRLLNLSEGEKVLTLTMEDWESARSQVRPSMTRGITKEVPSVTWDDIGGLKDLKKKLQQAVEWPIKHAAAFARLGITPVRGVLLHGPPGCSKTTLAKAAAHAAQASFFSLSGAELYSKYVGEGEALLRRTFQMAQLAAPSIIFFDEADAVAPKRKRWRLMMEAARASTQLVLGKIAWLFAARWKMSYL